MLIYFWLIIMLIDELRLFYEENSSEEKRLFDAKIINSKLKNYGIKTSILRKKAKELSINKDYLSIPRNESYENDFLLGVSMAYSKVELKEKFAFYKEFFLYVDNWSIVDSISSTLKIKEKYYDETLLFIKEIIVSNNEFLKRFGYVLFLANFVSENHLDDLFSLIDLKEDKYYVVMAMAWLLSCAYIINTKRTYSYLKKLNKNSSLLKYTIRKVLDSYRVSKEDKELIKTLRK